MSYEYPPILQGSAKEQIAALRDYLVRMVRDRESGETETVARAVSEIAATGRSATAGKSTAATAGGTGDAARLRALIQKTAEDSRDRDDVLRSSVGDLSHEMRQSYLARSEFGTYQQEVRLLIEATARQIVESYGYQELIEATEAELGEMGDAIARYLTEIDGEIRRGYLTDPDTHETVLGIAISQQLRFTGQSLSDGGWSYYELAPGQTLGLYTSTGWQFWVNGRKVGWFSSSDGMLHTVSQVVEEEIRAGDWSLSGVGGFGIKYLG
ncbi:MAG: hypothetical protein IK095_05030 [Oscillospiraceae bacterium]|nr:hypothetical protein [Oscillospiraceae bacterium]